MFVLRPMDFDPLEDEHCATVKEGMWETDLLFFHCLIEAFYLQFEWLLNACPEIQLSSRNCLQASGHASLGFDVAVTTAPWILYVLCRQLLTQPSVPLNVTSDQSPPFGIIKASSAGSTSA
ncbi:hypothetical protein B0H19DRAFT_1263079 [Mycena capillaripes]|nr:hypothetical protein B0H19DRAFT_1263079 [Mycena capillaripes]